MHKNIFNKLLLKNSTFMQKPLEIKNIRCVHMLDEINEIIMSNLTRSSIKAKAATATASKAIKTV